MRVLKGHGTENDFIIVPDLDGELDLTPGLVRALCDRHAGVGADGVLRVVRSENDPDAKDMMSESSYFMDYRNADGSVAEMCGNGIRVFMRYLQAMSLVETIAAVATRGGIRRVRARGDGNVTVDMGQPRILADRPVVTAALLVPGTPPTVAGLAPTAHSEAGLAVEMPNPHVVVPVGTRERLDGLDLGRPPAVQPPLPNGQNVEFVVREGARHLVMRVHERGVGETRSCGTGICAAAVAAAHADGVGADGVPWQVDVPGGTCWVTWRADGEVELTGPAVIVASVEVDDSWLAGFAAAGVAGAGPA